MTFTQHAEDCDSHPDCTVIVGTQDGAEVWRSHAPASVRPETRVNLDHPDIEDRRGGKNKSLTWDLVTAEEAAALGLDEEQRRLIAYHAATKGRATKAALAQKVGKSAAQLDAEATEKGWDSAQ